MSAIAVIGGGIAGLTVAHYLSAEHDVVVFEAETAPGGKIRSERIGEFLFEHGPSGFLSSAQAVRALVSEVGLDDVMVEAAPAAKNRFIYWDGKLHKLPSKPPEVFKMSLLSARGKVRALGELFVSRSTGDSDEDESVYRFMERRFGREVAERIATPALLGISGGDAASTSLAAIFPRLPVMEREHGSVLRGMMRGGRTAARTCSFSGGGMQRLTDRLAERLGNRLLLGTAIRRIDRHAQRWSVTHDGGETVVDGVVVTTPADVAALLVEGFDPDLAAQLRGISYAPMRAIGVAFAAADVPATLDGFGFLAARGCGVRILGATYTSTIMPDQAPPGTVSLRMFIGGATDPGAATLDAEAVRAIVLADLATVFGITAPPIAYHDVLWKRAIPQYSLRHRATVNAIAERAAAYPSFALAGNAYRGIGVGDTVSDARAVAATISASVGGA